MLTCKGESIKYMVSNRTLEVNKKKRHPRYVLHIILYLDVVAYSYISPGDDQII